jgi:hypothetical protein
LNPDKPTYVICQSGYRSSLGTSVLENAGFKEIYNVTGGTKAWMTRVSSRQFRPAPLARIHRSRKTNIYFACHQTSSRALL